MHIYTIFMKSKHTK